jgi:hypothetical protein
MIQDETVIIIGAGASAPYGYPTGNELRRKICTEFRDGYIALMERDRGSDFARRDDIIEGSRDFTEKFCRSNLSIDHFLAISNDLSEIGKVAITFTLLNEELKSTVPWDLSDQGEDWYTYLFNRMLEELANPDGFKKFGSNKIRFITFNYDRLLEHCIYENLTNSFPKVPNDLIVEQIKKIEFYHVYGKIADLLWESSKNRIPYQYNFDFNTIDLIKNNISIIGENKFISNIDLAKRAISLSKNIYFIGFGYARENLEILGFPQIINENHNIYGTAYKWSERKIDELKSFFLSGSSTPTNMQILNENSLRLLEDWF